MDSEYSKRAARKDEHIKMFLETYETGDNGFENVVLQNNALPEIDFEHIDASCFFLGKKAALPIMINAITGGTEYTSEINRQLGMLAKEFNIPMAVGSQTIAIQNEQRRSSFQVVREINKDGIIIANLSARSSYQDVCMAIEMLEADAVQLHLNVAQEICMKEGERHFSGILENIKDLVHRIPVPLIVKEVGYGIAYETAKKLHDVGVRYIDIGGRGGTNFIAIEACRNPDADHSFLANWGISTAQSLLECRRVSQDMRLICSGGITKAEEIIKSIAMGAEMTAVSGLLLQVLLQDGYEAAAKKLEQILYELKVLMLLLGASDVEKLSKTKYLLKGEMYQFYKQKFI